MAEIKWIKINTDMFDNAKIKFIRNLPQGNDILLIWIMLLVKAGRCNSNGFIFLTENIPYENQTIANEFNIPVNIISLAFETFERLKMIERDEKGFICITGWNEHQNADRLSEIREYNRIAKQKSRERQKLIPLSNNVNDKSMTSQRCQDTDIDIEIDKDKEKRYIYTSSQMLLAEKLKSLILRNNPKARVTKKLDSWANYIRIMVEHEGRSELDISNVIEWCQDDTFWRANILSAKKLKEKFDTLYLQMQRPPKANKGFQNNTNQSVNDFFTRRGDNEHRGFNSEAAENCRNTETIDISVSEFKDRS